MVTLVRNGLEIFYTSDSILGIKMIEKSLTYFVSGAEYSDLYRKKEWDGYKRFFDRRSKSFYFGLKDVVTKFLEKKKLEWEYKEDTDENKISIDISKLVFKTDRQYQIDAAKEFFLVRDGILKVFTRLGKTYIFAELINNVLLQNPNAKIFFICDSQDLILQAIDDIKSVIGLKQSQLGIIQGQKFKPSVVTFATVQTLDSILNRRKDYKNRKKKLTYAEIRAEKKKDRAKIKTLLDYFSSVTFLAVDECHMFSSPQRLSILKKIKNTSYRIALSATPFKKNDLLNNLSLQSIFGNVFFEVGEKEGVDLGYLAKSKVILLLINHEKNKNIQQADYVTLVERVIVSNRQRNEIIVNVVEMLRKLKLKTLVLFSLEKHVKKISHITGDTFITGKTEVKTRRIIKRGFLRGKGKTLFATNIFNKAITLPEADVIVNAAGGKEETTVIQKKGRVLGVTEKKKKALIIDFIDIYDYFSEHSYNRIEAYRETTGEGNMIVLDTSSEDFYTDFREITKSWFEE